MMSTTPNNKRPRRPPPQPVVTILPQMPSHQQQQQQLWQLAPMTAGGYPVNVLQPYGWQQMPAGQGQPAQHQGATRAKKRRQNKRRHNNQADTGVPSLSTLRKENRAKTRKYFAQGKARFNPPASVPRTTPRTAPRAPENTTTYLISGHAHDNDLEHVNQASDGAEGDGGEGGDATAIDFFGTNQGLITRAMVSDNDSGNSADNGDSYDDEERDDGAHAGDKAGVHPALLGAQHVPRHVAQQLQEQASYITQLEDENLNLRERQVQELQAGGPPPSSGDEAGSAG